MPLERTLSIIKPDATARNITGKIIAKFEEAGLRIVAQKRVHWDETDAAAFYAVHKERPFFKDLVAFMTSGPIVLQVLEGENAVAKNREIMVEPIQQMRRPAPSGRSSQRTSSAIQCTVPTAWKMPRWKWASCSRKAKSSVEWRPGSIDRNLGLHVLHPSSCPSPHKGRRNACATAAACSLSPRGRGVG